MHSFFKCMISLYVVALGSQIFAGVEEDDVRRIDPNTPWAFEQENDCVPFLESLERIQRTPDIYAQHIEDIALALRLRKWSPWGKTEIPFFADFQSLNGYNHEYAVYMQLQAILILYKAQNYVDDLGAPSRLTGTVAANLVHVLEGKINALYLKDGNRLIRTAIEFFEYVTREHSLGTAKSLIGDAVAAFLDHSKGIDPNSPETRDLLGLSAYLKQDRRHVAGCSIFNAPSGSTGT